MNESATRPRPGIYLRQWRERRRRNQLALALDADVSQRHLSYVETGRAAPSREFLLHLAEHLDIPLRDRNAMLVAGGYAPEYSERPLDDAAMAPVRAAIDLVLQAHAPCPALAVDRHWNLILANAALTPLLAGIADTRLLQPPVNVLRLSLHPGGLAPHIVNLPEWRAHLLERLARQLAATADASLENLLRELQSYPVSAAAPALPTDDAPGILVPLQLKAAVGRLNLISTTTVFGTPRDITLSELAIEVFFPADPVTRERLESMAVRAV